MENKLTTFFAAVLRRRYWIIAAYAVLLIPSIYLAVGVPQDNSQERLMVRSDPDFIEHQKFTKQFGQAEYVVLVIEADDPFAPEVLRRVDQIEQQLAKLPKVTVNSALTIYRRSNAGFSATPAQAQAFRKFATGTDLFRRQNLIGDRFLMVPLLFDVVDSKQRAEVIAAVDRVLMPHEQSLAPLTAIRKVGLPYINAYLDKDTQQASARYFPIFVLFVVVLTLFLYRSWRTLTVFLLSLGVCAAMTVGFVGLCGGVFTILSALVPMTILIVATATMVYIHSRYVDCPADTSPQSHLPHAVANKFLPCTASIFATAIGFAALAISPIQPIKELGWWVSAGLFITWIVVFTLFPCLQVLFKTPIAQRQEFSVRWYNRLVDYLPLFTYRYRFVLVGTSLVCALSGCIAIWGIPGHLSPMHLQTNALSYLNPKTRLYNDTMQLDKTLGGLSATEMWLRGPMGSLAEPQALLGLAYLEKQLRSDPLINGAFGPTTVLQLLRYVTAKTDQLPADDQTWEEFLDQVETVVARDPLLQRYFEPAKLSQTHITVLSRSLDYESFKQLESRLQHHFRRATAQFAALQSFQLRVVGYAPLQAKIAYHLVPTLVESLVLTVGIILVAFLLIFRSGPARILALIPSLVAILTMFAVMRVTGMSLNIATILIASTVLGASENDQIHFFYHFLEGRKHTSMDERLRHALRISGKAIVFATLINSAGFMGFALADLPPMREFGILSAVAFVVAMIAAFTALPAALWMIYRTHPSSSVTPKQS